jgi:Flp pilus assembly protein TadG
LRRRRTNSRIASRRNHEQGIVIVLVAVVMLFVIGAMAALSIDVVTLYTARSEAQLAADAGALAGARVFANSGVTSDSGRRSRRSARTLATTIATQVASQNMVGGRTLNPSTESTEVTVTFPNERDPAFDTNPHVTVQTQRTDLPTFFARIWGRTANTVTASATAEAYNPSGANALNGTATPVAPLCVKPWLLPNIDPTGSSANPIFTNTTGAIYPTNPSLVGQGWPGPKNSNGLYSLCNGGDCSTGNGGITAPLPGGYYPGAIDAADFPAPPAQASPGCAAGFNPATPQGAYQLAVEGCLQKPITCGANSAVNIDTTAYGTTRDADTVAAAACLIHYTAPGDSDSIDPLTTDPPFQFLAGNKNPVASAVGQDVMISDSLVTIPVINNSSGTPTNPVQIIGFLQVFLNPQSANMPLLSPPAGASQISATIINMAGCGTGATGQPILGNGASPVAVRLISPP